MAGDTHDAAVGASADDRISSILSELEEADYQVFDPPEDVWAGIEAAITSKPAPSQGESGSLDVPASTVVEYSIDADDVVIAVGQNWADFAHDNDAPELVVPPSNRTLWTYFENDEVEELWRLWSSGFQPPAGSRGSAPMRCTSRPAVVEDVDRAGARGPGALPLRSGLRRGPAAGLAPRHQFETRRRSPARCAVQLVRASRGRLSLARHRRVRSGHPPVGRIVATADRARDLRLLS